MPPAPAARLSDMTAHGGVIMQGFPTVLIGNLPAARMGDFHSCPLVNPAPTPVPHVGGPIMPPCSKGVFIGDQPAARITDQAVCMAPPDVIITGCATVIIGDGIPGGGGGVGSEASAEATAAAAAAIVGEPGPAAEGPHWIEIQFTDSAGFPITEVAYELTNVDGTVEPGILTLDGVIKRGGLPEAGQYTVQLFDVYNAKWSTAKAKVGDTVTLTADTAGYEDGTRAFIEIWERDFNRADVVVHGMEAAVDGDKIEAEWTYEYPEDRASGDSDEPGGYSSPDYYFIVRVRHERARSDILVFEDELEVELVDSEEEPVANAKYVLYLPNGEIRKGELGSSGSKKEETIPPGRYAVVFPDVEDEPDETE